MMNSTLHSITYVNIYSGASTSFYFVHWLPHGPLSYSHAALFSHTTWPNILVQCVFQNGFDLCLRPRLTNANILISCLQDFNLKGNLDVRLLKLKASHILPWVLMPLFTVYKTLQTPMGSIFGGLMY